MLYKTIICTARNGIVFVLYRLFVLIPLKNKVIASAFDGRKYGDNPSYILDELHKLKPDLDYVWIKRTTHNFEMPDYIRSVPYNSRPYKKAYEYATAKVWIDTHRLDSFVRKRKGQIFIETWHGGLGIKKLDGDVPKFRERAKHMKQVKNTSKLADVFISNSKHLTNIYRTAFLYDGPVWECGYPKNDVLFTDRAPKRDAVRKFYGLENDSNIFVYAPTFRDEFLRNGVDWNIYAVDFLTLQKTLTEKFGGKWYVLVKHHPFIMQHKGDPCDYNKQIINATDYPDMQELIMGCDALMSDYSSCIFDAAMTGIPCFTFATDFENYKSDRGVYYEMEELPFPYARNNEELMRNILGFDKDDYSAKWQAFAKRTGLIETGHAAKDIAEKIADFLDGNKVTWE